MSRREENIGFICINCGMEVMPLKNGSYRNHCPYCLHSVHMDDLPGDRASNCLGLMKPAGAKQHSKKGWQIVHHCEKCGIMKVNRMAPDDIDALIKMMMEN